MSPRYGWQRGSPGIACHSMRRWCVERVDVYDGRGFTVSKRVTLVS